jgi:signal transduction histidine kinase/DNA-binding response OmpR family regulator
MSIPILSLAVGYERDIVLARQRARQIAQALGFDAQDQTRIGTAVSEIARNAFAYAGGGRVVFSLEGRTSPQLLEIRIEDQGPGIARLEDVLSGSYRSPSGMGVGIIGSRRLMDQFEILTPAGKGTTIVLRKLLPRSEPARDASDIAQMTTHLAREKPRDAVEEVQRQNQELLRTLEELTRRQDELARLNRELDDTNRGVVALHAELDEKADHLRRADEIKTRFISNMSHEFRTPVNSIQALAHLLLERIDGELSAEQERQVVFIRKAADALSELVNDLLDLAKVEAGKTVVRPTEFTVPGLFGALRGMLRPLLVGDSVRLEFDEPEELPPLFTDEGKVSQILRNFISNALKFTEAGEVRVSARRAEGNANIVFEVTDTGIGIAPEDQERIFLEFAQVDSPQQRRVRGTGLGLPLCRRLAQLLGGEVRLCSKPGAGSTFIAEIPVVYAPAQHSVLPPWEPESGLLPVLVVEDRPEDIFLYERYFSGTPFGIMHARSLRDARVALANVKPAAIVLDILLDGEDAWGFLAEMKHGTGTREIPVVVVSDVDDQAKGLALGADAYCRKTVERSVLIDTLSRLALSEPKRLILYADDDEISRYLFKQTLLPSSHGLIEASHGAEALHLAHTRAPEIIVLDLAMPGMDGFEVLRRLEEDPATRSIPVVIMSTHAADPADPRLHHAREVIKKSEVTPERIRLYLEQAAGLAERHA